MALTEESIVDRVEVMEHGQLQVRTANVVKRDGVEISRTFHRHVVRPGDDLSGQATRVRDVGNAVHTDECIAAWNAIVAARNPNGL